MTMLRQPKLGTLELHVAVHRWSCTVTDPDGVTDSELHVPSGQAVRLVFENTDSAEDVGLDVAVGTSGHARAIRGVEPQIMFMIHRAGSYSYTWQCPVQMPPNSTGSSVRPIIVQSREDYAAYQASRAEPRPKTRDEKIALGKRLYEKKGCVQCHTLDGTSRIGPSWKGIWGKNATLTDRSTRMVDETYVRESILFPQEFARPGYPPSMPSFEGQLRSHEIDALTVLIASLAD
jgi:cytochrome c oxidase subunit II